MKYIGQTQTCALSRMPHLNIVNHIWAYLVVSIQYYEICHVDKTGEMTYAFPDKSFDEESVDEFPQHIGGITTPTNS